MQVEIVKRNEKRQAVRLEAYRKYVEQVRKKREVKKCSV